MIHSIPLRAIVGICLLILVPVLWTARAAQGISSVAAVSAASFEQNRPVAPGSIIAAFTSGVLRPGIFLAGADSNPNTPQLELPTILGEVSVEIHGRSAGIFAVVSTPGFDQLNLVVPEDLEPGRGPILIRNLGGRILAAGEIEIAPVAPSIFSADSNGQGVPAAQIVRVKADGTLSFESVAQFDAQLGRHLPLPIDLGPEGEQVFLVLYLTGVRQIANRTHTRILLGGAEYIPDFVGAAPGFIGLDQVNFRLPRTLRGRLSIAFSAIGYGTSKVLEIEIAAPTTPPAGTTPPSITGMDKIEMQAGEAVEIYGNNFTSQVSEVEVLFIDADRRASNAQVMEVNPTTLRVLVPYGAGSGQIAVRTAGGEARAEARLRTSLSGIIQRAERQTNGSYHRVGVQNMTVRMPMPGGEMTSTTNEDGAFLLGGVTASSAVAFFVDGNVGGTLPGLNVPYKSPVRAGRDNQYPGYVEVKAVGGASQMIPTDAQRRLPETRVEVRREMETTGVVVEPQGSLLQMADGEPVQGVTVTMLDPGRVPANLPSGQFSTTIVQITPTGALIAPGMKLTFPNTDGLSSGTEVSLFQYEVRSDNARLGEFVEIGKARVSADGQQIETAENAITVASYYFVSVKRPTVTLYGSVIEEDDRPARGALVQVRGQSAFSQTDDNGAFILPDVPFLSGTDLIVEVSYLRADGTVDRIERRVSELRANDLRFVSPAIVLPGQGRTRAPALLAPQRLTVEAGRTSDFPFLAFARSPGAAIASVTVAGAPFASVVGQGGDQYLLRLAPDAAGAFTLQLTATDTQGLMTTLAVTVEVRAANGAQPLAFSSSAVTNEDQPVAIALAGSNGNIYRIVAAPVAGLLGGTPPNLVYTPNPNFSGTDRFGFVVGNGTAESAPAEVTIAVRPVNDAPRLEVAEVSTTNIGQRLAVVINGFDVDIGQTLQLEGSNLPAGATIVQETATSWLLSWTPRIDQIGSYRVTLTLRDDGAPPLAVSRTVTLLVDAKWTQSTGPEAGEIRSFAFRDGLLFAGTLGGGVFRSIDQGISWTAINDGLPDRPVLALATSGGVLLAGIGFSSDPSDVGLYRSTDNGANWAAASIGLGSPGVNALLVRDNLIFAGTEDGVFVSTNAGDRWTAASNGLIEPTVLALAASGGTIFAGTEGGGVFRSTDNGNSWAAINEGLENHVISDLLARGEMVFAGTDDGLFRSTDGGMHWTRVANGPRESQVFALAASETTMLAGTFGDGIFRSTDNGDNWTEANNGLTDLAVHSLATLDDVFLSGGVVGGVSVSFDDGESWFQINHGLIDRDVFALAIGDGRVFAGMFAGGVFRSTDRGASWIEEEGGLPGLTIRSLAARGETVFAGMEDVGVYRSLDGGVTWEQSSNGLTIFNVYALAIGDGVVFAGTNGLLFRSTDNGANWAEVTNGPTGFSILSLAISEQTIFAATTDGVYRSTDNGVTWMKTDEGLTDRFVTSLAFAGGAVYAGTTDGVYRSTDNGNRWTEVNNGLTNLSVSAIVGSGSAVFAGTSGGGVFRTTDAGEIWGEVNSGLPNRFIYALAVSEGTIFAGTFSGGVYRLAEAAQVWAEGNAGLANRSINAATLDGGSFLVGTFGGGAFRSDDDGRNWTPSNTGLPPGADLRAFTRTAAGTYAGVLGSGVYFSSDQGRSWSARNSGLGNLYVRALVSDGTRIWAGTDDGVFRSSNNGMSWTEASNGLTERFVISLTVGPAGLLAGTDFGVFRSIDLGDNWTEINTGLDDLYIASLGMAPDGTTIITGTASGIYRSTNQGANWTKAEGGLPESFAVLSLEKTATRLLAGTVYGFFLSEDNGITWRGSSTGLFNLQVSALVVKQDIVLAGTRSGGVFTSRLE